MHRRRGIMPNGILCNNCKNIIPFNMISAVMSDACPFCGFNFASQGFEGLQECYTDIVDMFPSLGSLDFEALKGIVKFVFSPKFDENKDTLAKHLDVLAKIFNFSAVDEVDHDASRVEILSQPVLPPQPKVSKGPRITSGLGATAKNKRVRRRGEDGELSEAGADRRMPSQSNFDGGTFLAPDAIAELPPEFRERAKGIRTDADLRTLLRDVAFKNLEGLDGDV